MAKRTQETRWIINRWNARPYSAEKSGEVIVRSQTNITQGLFAHGKAAVDVLKLLREHSNEIEHEVPMLRLYTSCDIRSVVYRGNACSVVTRLQPMISAGCPTPGAAFTQMGLGLFDFLPPLRTPERVEFTLRLAERAAEQVRLRLREFLGNGVELQEWIGTAWQLKLTPYPPGSARPEITFDHIDRMDEFFSAYMQRDREGMPIPLPAEDDDG